MLYLHDILYDKNIPQVEIRGITSDSRKVGIGYVFFALSGTAYDGNLFIGAAIQNGAHIIISEQLDSEIIFKNNVWYIKCANARKSYAIAASRLYKAQPNTIVGITGTDGKTSVASFYQQICNLMDIRAVSIGTIGMQGSLYKQCSLTTQDPIDLFRDLSDLHQNNVQSVALEASSHGLHQYRIDGMKMRAAAFTNLTPEHLDYHINMDEYFNAKLRLFSEIAQEYAVINKDSQYYAQIQQACEIKNLKIISYGFTASDIQIIKQTPFSQGQEIEMNIFNEQHSFSTELLGKFQAYNIACALGLIVASGFDVHDALATLNKISSPIGRMQVLKTSHKIIIIDFAHTENALKNAIASIRWHMPDKNLVTVFGCGGNRDKSKRKNMGMVSHRNSDFTIITDDNPRTENASAIRAEILSQCPNALEIPNRKDAILHAIRSEYDVVLVAGKGHETHQIIGTEKQEFSDIKIVKNIIFPDIQH